MVLNCEPGKICWKSPGCVLVAAHVQRQCWVVPAHWLKGLRNSRNCKSKTQEWGCAFSWSVSLHYVWFEGRMSFGWQNVFWLAECLLASRVAVQEAALAWGRARQFQRICWKQGSAPEAEAPHRVHLGEVESHPLAAETCASGAFQTEVSHQMSAVAWGVWEYPNLAWLIF